MIGIVTFHFAYNYGAVLQAYALNSYINDNIANCKVINYRPSQIESNYYISIKSIIKNPKKLFIKIRRYKQDNLFDNFVETKLLCTKNDCILSNANNIYDTFVTGSDQVWNTELTHNDLNYFLNFATPKQKRVSYGASVGKSCLIQNYSDEIIEEIKKFDYLSCREKSAIEALNSEIGSQLIIESVVDPVLLLDKEEWITLCKKPDATIPPNFIVYYALTHSNELIEKTNMLSKKYHLPILSIHPMAKKWSINGKNLNNIGPLEFLWLINNADFVCTNSFHGSVFSTIFEKKCVLFAHQKLGERNKQLLEWMNLSQESFGEIIDFSLCEKKNLIIQIENSKKYLYEALK